MLSRTSEMAIRTLIFLALQEGRQPFSPTPLSERLTCSPSYLAKTLNLLVRAGILRSNRGAHGGVLLAKAPHQITLLAVVEACQGIVIGNYCSEATGQEEPVCDFHRAMTELYVATVKTLSKWTLADLIRRPTSSSGSAGVPCKMLFNGWNDCTQFEGAPNIDSPGDR